MNTIRMMGQVLAHPYTFYRDIQEPGMIRWFQSIAMLGLAYLAKMLAIYATSFAFQQRETYQISASIEFVWLAVPLLSWCITNWGVSTILDGEGKFKEIVHGSAFALVPYIVFIVPVTLITHLLSLQESGTYMMLIYLLNGWTIWLMLLKVKILHDFELGKMVLIVILSLIGIFIIWFIGILMFGLMNQFVNFIFELIKEVRLRV